MGTSRGASAPFASAAHSISATARAERGFFSGGAVCAPAAAPSAGTHSNATPHSSLRCILSARRFPQAADIEDIEDALMDVKDKAPDFILPDEDSKPVALKDFHGRHVVVYFFPRADTPG